MSTANIVEFPIEASDAWSRECELDAEFIAAASSEPLGAHQAIGYVLTWPFEELYGKDLDFDWSLTPMAAVGVVSALSVMPLVVLGSWLAILPAIVWPFSTLIATGLMLWDEEMG